MKHLRISIRITVFFTLLLGLAYPFAMTGIAQVLFKDKADGALISRGGVYVGAGSIAQKFEKPEYFWSRPSAVDYNPLPSGGSNLGQASADLKKAFDERMAKLKSAHPGAGDPPQDLLFASASGLDPDISPAAAEYQVMRVSQARGLEVSQVRSLIQESTTGRQFGILGETTVNVLALNLALDRKQGITAAPVLLPTPTPSPIPAAAGAADGAVPSSPPEGKK